MHPMSATAILKLNKLRRKNGADLLLEHIRPWEDRPALGRVMKAAPAKSAAKAAKNNESRLNT
jgi:hypothetical protein